MFSLNNWFFSPTGQRCLPESSRTTNTNKKMIPKCSETWVGVKCTRSQIIKVQKFSFEVVSYIDGRVPRVKRFLFKDDKQHWAASAFTLLFVSSFQLNERCGSRNDAVCSSLTHLNNSMLGCHDMRWRFSFGGQNIVTLRVVMSTSWPAL